MKVPPLIKNLLKKFEQKVFENFKGKQKVGRQIKSFTVSSLEPRRLSLEDRLINVCCKILRKATRDEFARAKIAWPHHPPTKFQVFLLREKSGLRMKSFWRRLVLRSNYGISVSLVLLGQF